MMNGKDLYHIQNLEICTDDSPYDVFVWCDHRPTHEDLEKIADMEALENEDYKRFVNNSYIYKVYAEEI